MTRMQYVFARLSGCIAAFLLLMNPLFASSAETADAPVNISLQITEAQSNNDTEWSLGFHDYIEVFNAGETEVMLSHYFLSRYEDDPFFSRLPAKKLKPGEYALLICDVDMLDFRLPKEGCDVYLTHREGVLCDQITIPAMENCVWLRGCGLSQQASPGYENTEEGALAYRSSLTQTLMISEVVSSNSKLLPLNDEYNDLIELCNAGSKPIELSEYYLSDKKSNPFLWQLPSCELAPGEFFIVQASGSENTQEEAPFKVSATGESLYLCDVNGDCVDALYIPALIPDTSYGRFQNNTYFYSLPSIGEANSVGYSGFTVAPENVQ